MKLIILFIVSFIIASTAPRSFADTVPTSGIDTTVSNVGRAKTTVPPVIHSAVGDSSKGVDGHIRLYNIGKRQQYSGADKSTFDRDIFSPKSVAFSSDGATFFINSLEGCRTVAYDATTLAKKYVVNYNFTGRDSTLWAPMSGYYQFRHYPDGANRSFGGKPVEMAMSHEGRYLWVPFYRRTFDLNAQDPSAIAVVDTHIGKLVRMFETGPLPKMVTVNDAGTLVAVTHWGDNTVGFIDISSPDIARWHHRHPVTVGHKLNLDYPLDKAVNRDAKSGYLLRGTVFTPNGRYLLVSGMGGPLAVIDVEEERHIGMADNLYSIRHIVIDRGRVYGSCNVAGTMISFSLDSLISAVERARAAGSRSFHVSGVKTVKVGGGARTLEVSPDGRFAFVACNSASKVYVVDNQTMSVVDTIRVDSYPVGLALAPDGRTMVVTSQGRNHRGGNAVNVFRIDRPDLPMATMDTTLTPDSIAAMAPSSSSDKEDDDESNLLVNIIKALFIGAIIAAVVYLIRRKHRK